MARRGRAPRRLDSIRYNGRGIAVCDGELRQLDVVHWSWVDPLASRGRSAPRRCGQSEPLIIHRPFAARFRLA
jgi:hypothetical protein